MQEPELTAEQNAILQDVFLYQEEGELTDADLKMLCLMFDRPEKLVLLRRALNILTPRERGIAIPDPQTLIDANPSDVQKYGIETAINARADEKMRQALVSLYRRVRTSMIDSKTAEFKRQNQEEFDEKQKSEGFDVEQEEANRIVGPRV